MIRVWPGLLGCIVFLLIVFGGHIAIECSDDCTADVSCMTKDCEKIEIEYNTGGQRVDERYEVLINNYIDDITLSDFINDTEYHEDEMEKKHERQFLTRENVDLISYKYYNYTSEGIVKVELKDSEGPTVLGILKWYFVAFLVIVLVFSLLKLQLQRMNKRRAREDIDNRYRFLIYRKSNRVMRYGDKLEYMRVKSDEQEYELAKLKKN